MLRLSQLHTYSGYLAFVSGPFLAGIGMGLSSSTRTTAIVDSLGPDSQGAASTMNDTTREVGSAIGTAIRGTVFAGQYRSALPHSRARLPTEAVESVRHSSADGLEVATPMGAEVCVRRRRGPGVHDRLHRRHARGGRGSRCHPRGVPGVRPRCARGSQQITAEGSDIKRLSDSSRP